MGKVVSLQKVRMERDNQPEATLDGGFIKLYRGIQDCSFKRDPERFALWVHMLLEASHKPFQTILGGKTVELMPGQFVSGMRDLEKETGVSFQRVRSSIEFFEREGMILRDTSSRAGTVFTVLKYESYQGKNGAFSNTPSTHQINTPSNTPEASNGAALGGTATRQETHHQHAAATPIQEDNNISITDVIDRPDCESEPEQPQAQKSKYPNCPHREILALWEEIIPETVQHNPNSWTSERVGHRDLAKRWKSGFVTEKRDRSGNLYHDKASGLEWWKRFFQHLRKSDFLINDCKPFCLEWAVKNANFNKIKEGNYHG